MDPISVQLFKSSTKDPGEFVRRTTFNTSGYNFSHSNRGGDVVAMDEDHYLFAFNHIYSSYTIAMYLLVDKDGKYVSHYMPYSGSVANLTIGYNTPSCLRADGNGNVMVATGIHPGTGIDAGAICLTRDTSGKLAMLSSMPFASCAISSTYVNVSYFQSSWLKFAGKTDVGVKNNWYYIVKGGDGGTSGGQFNGLASLSYLGSTVRTDLIQDTTIQLSGLIFSEAKNQFLYYGAYHPTANRFAPFLGVLDGATDNPQTGKCCIKDGNVTSFLSTSYGGTSTTMPYGERILDADYDPAQEVVWSGGASSFPGYDTVILNRTYQPFDPALRTISYNYNYAIGSTPHYPTSYCHSPVGSNTPIRGYHIASTYGGTGNSGADTDLRLRLLICEDRYGDIVAQGHFSGIGLAQTAMPSVMKPCPFNPTKYLMLMWVNGINIDIMRVRYDTIIGNTSFDFSDANGNKYYTWNRSFAIGKYSGQIYGSNPSFASYNYSATATWAQSGATWSNLLSPSYSSELKCTRTA